MPRRGRLLAFIGSAGIVAGVAVPRLLAEMRATDLSGKVVLITGSSRGLGFALAREFARHGARLVICARHEESLQTARAALERDSGAEVLAVPCDISQREQVERLVRLATERFGQIDVLVNNAGIIMVGPAETMTIADYEEALGSIFWGAVYATFAVLPAMRARGSGHITNITSIGGKVSVPHLLPYSAAKFALVGFSEGLRAEVAKHGIRVTTIAPGLMRTGSPPNAWFKGKHDEEYTWFSLSDNLPATSISARRAAKTIVAATRRGAAEVILSPQAKLLAWFHGLLPGTTSDILALIDRFLPAPGGIGHDRATGWESRTAITRSFLNALGHHAEHELNQYADPAAPPIEPGSSAETPPSPVLGG